MSQKSIQFLENISGLAYVPMSEPAHLVKDTFEQYFSGYETEDFSQSFKKAELKKISSTDISIKDIIDEIVEEYCRKEPDYFVPSISISTIYRDLDSVAKTFDNVWFSDFCAIDRLHVAKKKLRKMFADFVGEEVKSYEIDKIQTIGDAIQFLDAKIQLEPIDSKTPDSLQFESDDFRMPIEEVFYISGRGVVAKGRIEAGRIHSGDKVVIVDNHTSLNATVAGVEMFMKLLDEAEFGDNVGILLNGVSKDELSPGMLICSNNNKTNSRTNTAPVPIGKKHNTMPIDKSKIEYVIGIDLGHGETSAAICPIQKGVDAKDLEPAKDLEMGGNRKVIPSAIAILPNGNAYIGEAAFNPEILKQAQVRVCFKQRPENIEGEAEQLMIRFMKEVYHRIRENNSGMLSDDNHLVYIATPSGWDKNAQSLYLQMGVAAGLPMGGITKESRAAFVRAQQDVTSGLGKKIHKGAIVFDMGSSTLDFTYMNSELPGLIDYGYDCGASFIEKAIFSEKEKDDENIQLFEKKYPDLKDYLIFEARKIKEQIYFDPTLKVKKSINFDDFVDDEDLEDERFRLSFQPGELNQLLRDNGFLGTIENAMTDYINNHIKGHKIYGVFMTGGASRMDFLKDMICKSWGLEPNQVYRDQDPSLTISQGVAEVARMDLQTEGMDEGLEESISTLANGDTVFNVYSEILGGTLKEKVPEKVSEVLVTFRDDDEAWTLYGLQNVLSQVIEETVSETTAEAPDMLAFAIDKQTETIRTKVEAIVAHYSSEGVEVSVPTIQIDDIDVDIDLSSIVDSISSTIEVQSNNWVKYALMGVGAIFGLIGMGVGYLAGKLFSKNLTEEEKKEKAMSKELDSEERGKVFDAIAEEWDDITSDIENCIDDAISENIEVKRSIRKVVTKMLNDYKKNLAEARILID